MRDPERAFANISRIEPSDNLCAVILLRIDREKVRQAKIHLVYASTVGIFSLIALVPMIQYFISEFSQSGFYQYLSILFYDESTLTAYWKELGLSLLESLPTLNIILILILVFILLVTSKIIIKDSKTVFNRFNRTQLA